VLVRWNGKTLEPRAVTGSGASKTEGAAAPRVLCCSVVVLPSPPKPLVGCCVEGTNVVPKTNPDKPVPGAEAPNALVAGAGAGATIPPNPLEAGVGAPKVLPNAGAPKAVGAGAPIPPVDGAVPAPAPAPKGVAAGGDIVGLWELTID
jgi:hypothetical protein